MNTRILNQRKIDYELLCRYVEMRHKVDVEANSIQAISSLLSLFSTCGDDTLSVDPVALAKVNQIINNNILNIWEILDDFIYIVKAESELEMMASQDKNEFVYINPRG